jgi:undecaprenyl pyrophosphate phosphatase UppP
MKQVHIDIINKAKKVLKSLWLTVIILCIIALIVSLLFVISDLSWIIPLVIIICIDIAVFIIMRIADSLQKRLEDYEQTHKND